MTPRAIECPDRRFAALARAGDGPRVLALHGWMDNAASFGPLGKYLDGIDLVCLEFPGHGCSEPRPPGARYHFDDYVFDVLAVADSLGWDRFHVLGHSLGGAVGAVLAAASPERVLSLVLIEGLGPISMPPDKTASGWRQAIGNSQKRPRRVYRDVESAAQARSRDTDLPLESAQILAERGLVAGQDGLRWGHDPRLAWPSTSRYTEPQVLDLLASIQAPVLNIRSEPLSGILPEPLLQRRLAALRDHRILAVPGGHHLHMHNPARIAPAILEHVHTHDG